MNLDWIHFANIGRKAYQKINCLWSWHVIYCQKQLAPVGCNLLVMTEGFVPANFNVNHIFCYRNCSVNMIEHYRHY